MTDFGLETHQSIKLDGWYMYFQLKFLRKSECLTCKYKYANIILIFDNMQIFANTVSNARRSYLDLNMNNDKC